MDYTKYKENYMIFIKKSYEEKKIIDSCIEESKCIELIKAAVKESVPLVKKEVNEGHLYGLSFELSNTVDRSSYYSYNLEIYFNTEESISESSYPDDLDFRYGMWSEWMVLSSDTESAKVLKEYLYQNRIPSDDDLEEFSEEMNDEEKTVVKWYKNECLAVDDKQTEERAKIRKCVTLAVAELNKEKFFFEMFGSVNVYPFYGECALKKEEILEHYSLMENETADEKFIDYISCQE